MIIWIGIGAGVLVASIIFALVTGKRQERPSAKALEWIPETFRAAHVEPKGPTGFPIIHLKADESPATVTYSEEKDAHFTFFISTLPSAPFGMQVFKERRTGPRSFSGVEHLETGDEAFDAAFIVQGNSEKLVRQVLNEKVRTAIRLDEDSYIQVMANVLLIQKNEFRATQDDLEPFIKNCIAILRSAREAKMSSREQVRQLLETAAMVYGGRVDDSAPERLPLVRFMNEGRVGQLQMHHNYRVLATNVPGQLLRVHEERDFTRFIGDLRTRERLRVASDKLPSKRTASLGDPEFDRRYAIDGSGEFAREVLDEAFRASLQQLADLDETRSIVIELTGERLIVEKPVALLELGKLRDFLRQAYALWERLSLTGVRSS